MNQSSDRAFVTVPLFFGGITLQLSMAIYFDPPLANKIDPPFLV